MVLGTHRMVAIWYACVMHVLCYIYVYIYIVWFACFLSVTCVTVWSNLVWFVSNQYVWSVASIVFDSINCEHKHMASSSLSRRLSQLLRRWSRFGRDQRGSDCAALSGRLPLLHRECPIMCECRHCSWPVELGSTKFMLVHTLLVHTITHIYTYICIPIIYTNNIYIYPY